MKRRTKLIVASVVAAATVVAAGAAIAGKGHGNGERSHMGWKTGKIADWLDHRVDLTVEQRGRVVALGERFHERMKANRQAAVSRVASAIRAPTLERQEASELIGMHRNGHESMRDAMAETLVDLHAILTPEQRDALAESLANHGMFRRGHGRGHRHGHGHGGEQFDD